MKTIPETWKISKDAVFGEKGMVSSQHPGATQLGVKLLSEGWNAVDVAVSVGLAMGCLEPWMSGIGGGGYMLVYNASEDRSYCVDFGVVAPREVDPADYPMLDSVAGDMFGWPSVVDDRNIHGPYSIAVPGHVAGMDAALSRFGKISWKEALQPAIELAKEGMPADWFSTVMISSAAKLLARNDEAARTYLPGGLPPTMDWHGMPARLKIGNLEATLTHLAEAGAADFYKGELAQSIVSDARAAGSCLSLEDLENYSVTIAQADAVPYRDSTVHIPVGLNAGPTLRHALKLLEENLRPGGAPGEDAYCAFADALLTSYEHRLSNLGDNDDGRGQSCTTHFNVVDSEGNMVSLTQTLLSTFGSRVMLPQSGILLNNGMMWFDPRPDHPNSIRPGGKPLSNMCPVIVRRKAENDTDSDLLFALGASGGRRIFPSVMQIISFLVDYRTSEEEALSLPRIDCNGSSTLTIDAALPQKVQEALGARAGIRPVDNGLYPPQFATPTLAGFRTNPFRSVGMAHPHSPWACAGSEGSVGK